MINAIVVGPRDRKSDYSGYTVINTTSKSKNCLWTQLSPFHLGPVTLWGGYRSLNMENAWQYSKVYKKHITHTERGDESLWGLKFRRASWLRWAKEGWNNPRAVRYPMGRGAKPEFSYWNGERYGYVQARAKIYIPLYADLVRRTEAFSELKQMCCWKNEKIALWDFDGYMHRELGMTLLDVLTCPNRKMGHAFVLLMLFQWGDTFYKR